MPPTRSCQVDAHRLLTACAEPASPSAAALGRASAVKKLWSSRCRGPAWLAPMSPVPIPGFDANFSPCSVLCIPRHGRHWLASGWTAPGSAGDQLGARTVGRLGGA